MNEAIKLAVEKGGYNQPNVRIVEIQARRYGKVTLQKWWQASIIQDPLFWQALGKALGWADKVCERCGGFGEKRSGDYEAYCCGSYEVTGREQEGWLFHALYYHELNLIGGDTEKFWKELLK